ncbi:Uncharacterised protein [Mycobacteroides abscessus subsp. abscessus]|nr:Uncharacterised protein [Mycobacteroides abscessus subsp. abscessus]
MLHVIEVSQIDDGPSVIGGDAADPVPTAADRERITLPYSDFQCASRLVCVDRQKHTARTARGRVDVPNIFVAGVAGSNDVKLIGRAHQCASGPTRLSVR